MNDQRKKVTRSQVKKAIRSKQLHRRLAISLGAFFVVVMAVLIWYMVVANTYNTKFLKNTYINGEDVSGKTVEEVEAAIKAKTEEYTLTVTFRGDTTETLDAASIGYQYVSDGSVQKALDAQNSYSWLFRDLNIGDDEVIAVPTATTFDADTLRTTIEALPEMQADNDVDPVDAYINLKDTRFEIIAEVEGTQLNEENLITVLSDAITNMQTEIDLNNYDTVYNAPSVLSSDSDLNAQVDDLNAFLDTTVTYTLESNEEVVDRNIISKWIAQSDTGYYYIDTEYLKQKINEFVQQLATLTDYISSTKKFKTTNNGEMTLNTSEYGTTLNQEAEADALYNNLINRVSETREPIYSRHDSSTVDYGGTYVEVDIEAQHVYYYRDNVLTWDCDCVTGTYLSNMTTEAAQFIYPDLIGIDLENTLSTPKGVFFIFEKKSDYLLHGPEDEDGNYEWESHVDYWMPFNKTVGLHDASWRTNFGGELYKTEGSHGCVNLPVDKAGELYDLVDVGTIVVVD